LSRMLASFLLAANVFDGMLVRADSTLLELNPAPGMVVSGSSIWVTRIVETTPNSLAIAGMVEPLTATKVVQDVMICCGGGVGEGEREDVIVTSYDVVETINPWWSVVTVLKEGMPVPRVGERVGVGSELVTDIVLIAWEPIEFVALEMAGDPSLVFGWCVFGPSVIVENVQPDWTVECNVSVLPTTQDTKVGVLVGGCPKRVVTGTTVVESKRKRVDWELGVVVVSSPEKKVSMSTHIDSTSHSGK
jgi:hypothetical protein